MTTRAKIIHYPESGTHLRGRIRLACDDCMRDDFSGGITPAELVVCRQAGWEEITREQTFAESCKTYDDPRDEPRGYSILDWWTHRGVCPECAKDRRRKGG